MKRILLKLIFIGLLAAGCRQLETKYIEVEVDGGVEYIEVDGGVRDPEGFCPVKVYYVDETVGEQFDNDEKLEKLAAVTHFAGNLIVINPEVTTVENLKCMEYVAGSFTITETSVKNVESLTNLRKVSDSFIIHQNSQLESLAGLKDTPVSTLQIGVHNNPLLNQCEALEWIDTIDDYGFDLDDYCIQDNDNVDECPDEC